MLAVCLCWCVTPVDSSCSEDLKPLIWMNVCMRREKYYFFRDEGGHAKNSEHTQGIDSLYESFIYARVLQQPSFPFLAPVSMRLVQIV